MSSLTEQAVKAGVGAVPNMAAILPAEAGDDSDDELELQGQGTISLKCPLLFTDFVKPMRKYVHCVAPFGRHCEAMRVRTIGTDGDSTKCPHRVECVLCARRH